MTLPFATGVFTVRRATAGSEDWEPGADADVATGVPGHLSVGGGSRVTTAEGTATTTLIPLALDTFAGELLPGDQIVDAAGRAWLVVFAHLRPLIPHWQAAVRSVVRT